MVLDRWSPSIHLQILHTDPHTFSRNKELVKRI